MDQARQLIAENNLSSYIQEGILLVSISEHQGLEFSKELLYRVVSSKTLLLLSGGRTPKDFYTTLAKEETVIPGAVGQIDERYGVPFHDSSNQRMLQETGLLRYFQMRDIPFYPILGPHPDPLLGGEGTKGASGREETAEQYDSILRDSISRYRQVIGILGVGLDGHTAGIPANPEVWKEFSLAKKGKTEYVVDYDDHGKFYHQRVTMTFLGLSMLDLLIVLVFGPDKRSSLEKLFSAGSEEEIPSRFYKRPQIAKKTLLITDQAL